MSEQDIDLRRLRYFLAVAAESNFGRAAARLHRAVYAAIQLPGR